MLFHNYMSYQQIAHAIETLEMKKEALTISQYGCLVLSINYDPMLAAALMLHPIRFLNMKCRQLEEKLYTLTSGEFYTDKEPCDYSGILHKSYYSQIESFAHTLYRKQRIPCSEIACRDFVHSHMVHFLLEAELSNEISLYVHNYILLMIEEKEKFKDALHGLKILFETLLFFASDQYFDKKVASNFIVQALFDSLSDKSPQTTYRRLMDAYISILPLAWKKEISHYHSLHWAIIEPFLRKNLESDNLMAVLVYPVLSKIIDTDSAVPIIYFDEIQKENMRLKIQNITSIPSDLKVINTFFRKIKQDDTWPNGRDCVGLLQPNIAEEDWTFSSLQDWFVFFEQDEESKKKWVQLYRFYCEVAIEKILTQEEPDAIILTPFYDAHYSLVSLKMPRDHVVKIIENRTLYQEDIGVLCKYITAEISKNHHFSMKHLSYVLDIMQESYLSDIIQICLSYPRGSIFRSSDSDALAKHFDQITLIQQKIFRTKKAPSIFEIFVITPEHISQMLKDIRYHILSGTQAHGKFRSFFIDIDITSRYMDLNALSFEEKNNFLLFACRYVNKRNRLSLIKRLLLSGARAESYYDNGKNAIILLATEGHEEELDLVLSYSPHSLYKNDKDGHDSLSYAMLHEQIGCLRVLKKHGAFLKDPDLIQKDLILAAKYLCIESIKETLTRKHDYPITAETVETFLKYLLKKNRQAHSTLFLTVIMMAIEWEIANWDYFIYLATKNMINNTVLVQEIIQKGLLKFLSIANQKKLLFHAIKCRSFTIVHHLITHDRSLIDMQNKNGDTPLMYAIEKEWTRGIKYFLDNDSNITIKNYNNETAFELAEKQSEKTRSTTPVLEIIKMHLETKESNYEELNKIFDEFMDENYMPFLQSDNIMTTTQRIDSECITWANTLPHRQSHISGDRAASPDQVDSDPSLWKTLQDILSSPMKTGMSESSHQEIGMHTSSFCSSHISFGNMAQPRGCEEFTPMLFNESIGFSSQGSLHAAALEDNGTNDHRPKKKNRFS